MQISYDDPTFPSPNSAFMIGKTCGRSKTMFSIGWCPNYCPGSDPSACPGVTIQNTCDYDYGDRFCQDQYGGQLASIEDQVDYDRVAALIPNDQTPNQFGVVTGNEKCKIVILSRFVALSVSLTRNVSLFQTCSGFTRTRTASASPRRSGTTQTAR
eukprot:COSAG04_NODE_64_length_29689_cov_158.096992_12_plen_156_part_00